MNRILLIGNSGLKHHGSDGQTVKVRLYLKKMKDEGFDVEFVDLESFIKHPISCLLKIKQGIKTCDRIVLISASRGCRILIPYVNRINKNVKKPFVLPLIGTSVLHHTIDRLNDNEKNTFIINKDFSKSKHDKGMSKQLSKISFVLPETDLLTDVFKDFYHLNNVFTLQNFREHEQSKHDVISRTDSILRIVFISRVMKMKGIFDVIEVVNNINEHQKSIVLDIYGPKDLSDEEETVFNNSVDGKTINYLGLVKPEIVIDMIHQYDLFVFPTHFVGEGTPGVIAESLIAGTPILTSSFPQANFLLKDGVDSLFFKMFDKEDLKKKLLYLLNDRKVLDELKRNALESGKRFTYGHERNLFLKYVCGVEK